MQDLRGNEILIIYNSVSYFLPEIQKKGYSTHRLYQNEGIINRGLRKIFKKLNFNESPLYGNWFKKLRNYKIIIVFAPVEIDVLKKINTQNPQAKIVYWYWNPAYRIGRPTPELYELCDIWTFDKQDAKKYNLKYNNTFYFDTVKKKEVNKKL